MKVKTGTWIVVLVVLSLSLGACGGATGDQTPRPTEGRTPGPTEGQTPESPPDEEQELEEVRIQFDWFADAQYAAFFLAQDRGYFADEGLEPVFTEGGGAVSAAQVIGAGNADIVFGTLDEVVLGVEQGIDLKAVAVIEQTTPAAIIVLEGSDIEAPEDLVGRSVGALAAGASGTLYEPYLEAVGIDPATVERVTVDFQAQPALLLSGEVDAITGFPRTQGALVEIQGPDIRVFPYSDAGLRLMGLGIYTRTEVIENNPEMVAGVVRAALRGIQDFMEDPAPAIEVTASLYPEHYENTEYVERYAERTADDYRMAMSSQLGFMEPELWETTVNLLRDYFGVEEPLAPEEYYTNEFIPEE